jgi:hypothetical protein
MSEIKFPLHSKFVGEDGEISRPWLMWLQNPQVLSINIQAAIGIESGGTGLTSTPTNGQLLIGNGTGYALGTLTATGMTVTNGAGSIALSLNTFSPTAVGGVPASGGGTTNFLRADGTFAAPPVTAPASPITSVQFNNSGVFGGSGAFTYNSGTDTLSVGNLVAANFTNVAQGLVPASGGGTTNFLRADGSFALPTATAIPAGSDTQVQYNNASAFGANANFAYTVGTNTLTLGTLTSPSGGLTITPFAPAAGTAPGAIAITGAASQDANSGGAVNITSGAALAPSTGIGGALNLTGGNAISAAGGNVVLRSGSGTTSGVFQLLSATASTGSSGGFTIGSGTGIGSGNFSFGTGNGTTGNSGNQSFSTGASTLASGTTGSYTFATGAQNGGGTSGSFNVNIGASSTGTGGSIILRPGSGVTKGSIRLRSSLVTDVIQITDNGTNQIGFFAATPVVKQSTAVTGAAYVAGPTVGVFHTDDTYGGYTIGQIVAALQAYGLLT